MRQRDVHISRRDTWMARKFFIFLYLKDAFFPPTFLSIFSFCTGPHQFCELVLQGGMWMYEPVITVDPGFFHVTDAHGQALQSEVGGARGQRKISGTSEK